MIIIYVPIGRSVYEDGGDGDDEHKDQCEVIDGDDDDDGDGIHIFGGYLRTISWST